MEYYCNKLHLFYIKLLNRWVHIYIYLYVQVFVEKSILITNIFVKNSALFNL